MKNKLLAMSMLSLAVIAGTANANSMSSELGVKGKVNSSACQVSSLSKVELGRISSAEIKPDASTALPSRVVPLLVTCEADTYLSFNVVDNREGTASESGTTHFGLGNVNNTGKLGYYQVDMEMARVDLKATNAFSTPNKDSIEGKPEVLLDKNNFMGWATQDNQQASGKMFTANLRVSPVLASAAQMEGPISDVELLDGSMTMNFNFAL